MNEGGRSTRCRCSEFPSVLVDWRDGGTLPVERMLIMSPVDKEELQPLPASRQIAVVEVLGALTRPSYPETGEDRFVGR